MARIFWRTRHWANPPRATEFGYGEPIPRHLAIRWAVEMNIQYPDLMHSVHDVNEKGQGRNDKRLAWLTLTTK